VPILRSVTFLDAKTAYPQGLKMGLSYADASQILGAPSYKSSDIAKIWLNDDGGESFYGWHKTIDEAKQIALHARIKTDGVLDEINAEVIALKEIFSLFDAFNNQDLSHFLNNPNQYNSPCIFIEWAIKNGLYVGQANEQAGIAAVKSGLSMRDFFQQHVKTTGVYLQYFAPAHQ
jgi:hypothetical protein